MLANFPVGSTCRCAVWGQRVAVGVWLFPLVSWCCLLPDAPCWYRAWATVFLSVRALKNYFEEVICIETHARMHLCIRHLRRGSRITYSALVQGKWFNWTAWQEVASLPQRAGWWFINLHLLQWPGENELPLVCSKKFPRWPWKM